MSAKRKPAVIRRWCVVDRINGLPLLAYTYPTRQDAVWAITHCIGGEVRRVTITVEPRK